jgi:uncharacterized protein YyaL (SSP411 family)
LTGRGGWSLTVLCLPDGTPFYASTAVPPDALAARYRMPGWRQVLRSIAEAYRSRRAEVTASAIEVLDPITLLARPRPETAPLDEALPTTAAAPIGRAVDDRSRWCW